MTVEDYIIYRIETLYKAKFFYIEEDKPNKKDMLYDINTRLSELTSMAVRFNLLPFDQDEYWKKEFGRLPKGYE